MPLKCDEVYPLLQAYLDGEAGPEEERRLEVHVRLCPSCRKKLFSLQRLISSLEAMDEVGPGDDFTARVIARLPDAPRKGAGFGRRGFWKSLKGSRLGSLPGRARGLRLNSIRDRGRR